MAKIKFDSSDAAVNLKAIELLNTVITVPEIPDIPLDKFYFNVSIDSRSDESKRLIFVIVHIEIKSNNKIYTLGKISVNCIFEIVNYDHVVSKKEDGSLNIPANIIDALNSISLSTTRGIMFSTFKGTFLHNAIMPILDPKDFRANN